MITAGLNAVTMIVGFAVFAAIRRTLAFDKRLVFAGYRQAILIAAKTLAIAAAVAAYTSLVLLAFWRPGPAGWPAAFATAGLLILQARTRTRTHHDRRAASLMSARRRALQGQAPG